MLIFIYYSHQMSNQMSFYQRDVLMFYHHEDNHHRVDGRRNKKLPRRNQMVTHQAGTAQKMHRYEEHVAVENVVLREIAGSAKRLQTLMRLEEAKILTMKIQLNRANRTKKMTMMTIRSLRSQRKVTGEVQ